MKRFFFSFCVIAFAGISALQAENSLPAPKGEEGFIYFTADDVTANSAAQTIHLTGNVSVVQQTKDGDVRTLNGEDLTLDQLHSTVSSSGPVHMETAGGVVDGNNIFVNYQNQDFHAENIQTEYPPLRVLSAKSISSKNGTQRLKKAVLTCCDQTPPHYTITLGSVKLSPQKRVFGTNAVFKLDGVPIMWLPVYWRSLDSQKPWTTYVDFTQSNKIGFGLLTSSVFHEILGFRPKINLDYYTKSGFGMGAELMAVETDKLKGTGEAYYINDHAKSDEDYTVDGKPFQLQNTKRWGIRGGYWWEMYDSSDHFNNPKGALYQFQTQFRMVSDPYFNDSFFRGNPYIFTPDQQTNFSVSRQSRASTLRLSYTQQDIFDWSRGEFIAKERNIPQLEYTLMPFRDPLLHLTHRFEVNFNNTSIMEESWKREGNARWTTEKSIRITRGLTFLPSVFYDQHLTLQDPDYKDKNAWVGRAGTDLNLQTETLIGTLDTGYQYTRRFSTGTIQTDRLSADQGEERNRIYVQNYFRPNFNTYVRIATGFSLVNHDSATRSWDHLKHRIEPILVEGGYTSNNGAVHLFAQNLYDLIEKNQAFIAQTNFVVKGQSLSIGMTNYDTHQDPYSLYQTYSNRYTFTTLFGLQWPGSTWHLDLGTDLQLQAGHLTSFNKLARLSKDFHDARLDFSVRDRNNNLSFAFRINVLCGGKGRAAARTRQEEQLYPWRGSADLRDM